LPASISAVMTAWLASPFLPLSSMTRAGAAFAVRSEAGRVLGVIAGVVDGEGDRGRDAARLEIARRVHPGVEVLAAMAGRGMDEAGTGIVGDVIAGDQRHGKIIAAAEALATGGRRPCLQVRGSYIAQTLEFELGLGKALLGQRIGEDQLLARLRAEIVFRRVTS
jgi:hypothetical protein